MLVVRCFFVFVAFPFEAVAVESLEPFWHFYYIGVGSMLVKD